jgi:hypothetical protein
MSHESRRTDSPSHAALASHARRLLLPTRRPQLLGSPSSLWHQWRSQLGMRGAPARRQQGAGWRWSGSPSFAIAGEAMDRWTLRDLARS